MAGKGQTIDVTYEKQYKENLSRFQPPGTTDVICTRETVVPSERALLDPRTSPGYSVVSGHIIPPPLSYFNAAEYEKTLNKPGDATVDFQFGLISVQKRM